MVWPPNDSPFWPIFRVTIRTSVLLGGLLLFYQSGMELPDVKLILTMILADAGLSTQAFLSRNAETPK